MKIANESIRLSVVFFHEDLEQSGTMLVRAFSSSFSFGPFFNKD